MNYQRSNWGNNCSCSSCNNNERSGSQNWVRRNWDACGCQNAARSGCGCANNAARSGCGCANNSARSGCGCANNSARSGCGCANNAARSGCGCANNSARSGCGCANNAARSGCGCANNSARSGSDCDCHTSLTEARLEQRSTCPCPNQGTEWRNRSGCNNCTAARISTPCTACNRGAEDRGILTGHSLAMVYSPYQQFEELYDPREGLCSGTIFSGLNKPFCPKCGC